MQEKPSFFAELGRILMQDLVLQVSSIGVKLTFLQLTAAFLFYSESQLSS